MRSVGIGFFSTLFPRLDGNPAGNQRRRRSRSFRSATYEVYRQPHSRARDRPGHGRCRWRSRHDGARLRSTARLEGRLLPGRDGRHFPIDDLNDAIEYLANRHGVITVNNGMDNAGHATAPGRRGRAGQLPQGHQSASPTGFGEMHEAPRRNRPAKRARRQSRRRPFVVAEARYLPGLEVPGFPARRRSLTPTWPWTLSGCSAIEFAEPPTSTTLPPTPTPSVTAALRAGIITGRVARPEP